MSVVKEKIVKTNSKQSDDSKIPKRLENLIPSYWQTLFTDEIGKLNDTKIKLHINEKIPSVAQAEHRTICIKEKGTKRDWTFRAAKYYQDITSEATPWLSQLVIAPESDGGIMLYIDMRNANTAI